MADKANVLAHRLEQRLLAAGNAAMSSKMEAYMKGNFKMAGVYSTERKLLFGEWYADNKTEIQRDLRAVAKALYQSPFREMHYCAIELLMKIKSKLQSDDIALVEWMLVTNSWWDSVDALASNLVGQLFKDRDLRDRKTEEWMQSGNLWLVRSCIISQLKYGLATDVDYLFALIDMTSNSKEFFIQKANGWALRQLSKHHPSVVRDFVGARPHLPRVTMREAEKYLEY